mgnify:CR=1 FL=1|tara:strand:- start:822 stop:1163 length:342 start_codon:yes stop_codon:yes gene_type:complete
MAIKEILDLVDGSITDAEFEAELERTRFLMECKKNRFNDLQKQGLISFPVKVPRKRNYVPFKGRSADEAMKKVIRIHELRHAGAQAKEACAEVGVPYQTYHDWTCKLDMKFIR